MGNCRIGQIKNPFGEGCIADVTHQLNKNTKKSAGKKQGKLPQKNPLKSEYQKCSPKKGYLVWNNPFTQKCDQVLMGAKFFVEQTPVGKPTKKMAAKWSEFRLNSRTVEPIKVGSGKAYEPKETDAAAIYKKPRTITINLDPKQKAQGSVERTESQPARLGGKRQ